jgi:hypothetical protein
MPVAQNHARKDAEKTKQNTKDRTKIHCTNYKTSYKTKQLHPRKKGGKRNCKTNSGLLLLQQIGLLKIRYYNCGEDMLNWRTKVATNPNYALNPLSGMCFLGGKACNQGLTCTNNLSFF